MSILITFLRFLDTIVRYLYTIIVQPKNSQIVFVSSLLMDTQNTPILITILLNSTIALILIFLMLKRINIIYTDLKITNWTYNT